MHITILLNLLSAFHFIAFPDNFELLYPRNHKRIDTLMMNIPFKEALLIDDDPTAHLIHAQFLKKLSVAEQVSKVGNGQQALDFIRRYWREPGSGNRLVVVDLHMPVMDGFEFLVHFYAMHLPEKITTVVLTSSANEQDVRRAKLFPLLAYIEKPLTKKKIENMLDQYFSTVTDSQAIRKRS